MIVGYPNITGATDKEQLAQIKSYLHQLADLLNYAIPASGGEAGTEAQTQEDSAYYELRSLVGQALQRADELMNDLKAAKENGEFDGHTPKKGVDYFTEAEISAVALQAAGEISFTLDENGNLYYEVGESI